MARLEDPGTVCVDLVYEELQRIATQAEPSELTRYPVLRERIVEVMMNLLRRCVGPTQMMVTNLVKIELSYVNTSHPDFIGGSRAVSGLMQKVGKENDKTAAAKAAKTQEDPGTTPLASTSLNNYGAEGASENGKAVPHNPNAGNGIMGMLFNNSSESAAKKKNDRRSMEPPSIVTLPQVPDRMKQTDKPASEKEVIEMEVSLLCV